MPLGEWWMKDREKESVSMGLCLFFVENGTIRYVYGWGTAVKNDHLLSNILVSNFLCSWLIESL